MMYGFVVKAWLVTEGKEAIPFATVEGCEAARDQLAPGCTFNRTFVYCLPTGATPGQE